MKCANCIIPNTKKPCLVLAAQREAERVAAEEAAKAAALEREKLEAQPAFLAATIAQQAIDKALQKAELAAMRDASAPAAMAAKLRSRSSVPAPDAAKEEAKPETASNKVITADKEVKEVKKAFVVPKLVPGLPPPPPTWVPERLLPLWLISQYEERVRREGANAAARELQAAARTRALLNDAAATLVARRAAQVAAAAAADSCAVCSGAQGDDTELDGLWICCDLCNRWFHGACVSMTQDDVDAIPDDEPWNCPGCWNTKRKNERAARREGKVAQPFSPSEEAARGRGRPPKPFYEKADYKAAEAAALERLQKKKRAKPEPTEEELAEEEARRVKRAEKKRQREAETEAAAAKEELPVWCPVCAVPDYGRPLVQCDGCQEWFHYECAGIAAEVGVGAAE
jgi:hypothetical protein